MEDVFYLMKATVRTSVLKSFLIGAGYVVETVPAREESWLTVHIHQARFEWDFVADVIHDLSLEPEAIEACSRISLQGGWIISYHPSDLPELRALLVLVLRQFGGWVGCDDLWTVLYTAETIDQMRCADADRSEMR